MAAGAAPSRLATARKGPSVIPLDAPNVGSKLLCWVKARVGLQESVELAGDIADQAASDLAVGLALGAAPLGVGAGRRVIAQPGQHYQVQGLVELADPG